MVVMFTDGRSTGASEFLFPTEGQAYRNAMGLVDRALQADVAIYSVGFVDSMVDGEFLKTLERTGGVASLLRRDADLHQVFKTYLDDLRMDYLLGFVPAKFDGKSHKIDVKVNRPGVAVRARASYFAAKR